MATTFAWCYQELINLFGFFVKLDEIPSYFGSRLWILSKKNIFLIAPIFGLSLSMLAIATYQTFRSTQIGYFSRLGETKKLVILGQSATLACDVLVTAELFILLHKNQGGLQSTNNSIAKLATYAINRGIATCVLAVGSLILFLIRSKSMEYMIPLLPTAQLYALNVVSSLLMRRTFRDGIGYSKSASNSNSRSYSVGGFSGSSYNININSHNVHPESYDLSPIGMRGVVIDPPVQRSNTLVSKTSEMSATRKGASIDKDDGHDLDLEGMERDSNKGIKVTTSVITWSEDGDMDGRTSTSESPESKGKL
ncbi:hypothetical protein VKT23_017584 [Stygiomarasmius scandens]|uniref:DUF6534 domain-containing protein n=1 Tax=Marasmiellus scandens TaxID=2682957 RepID=A0ABR1IV04_9AGAR